MLRRTATIGGIAMAIVGLGASVTALIDDLGGAPTFCAETGCETVRASAWARPLGIPMSVLGVAFFTACIVVAFVNAPRLRRWLALVGGAWAAWLIGLQAFAIGAWCKLCLIADPAAIGHAIAVVAGASTARFGWRRIAAVAPAVAGVVVALAAWTAAPDPEAAPPAPVVATRQPGAVTIVEFVDFECPFCRELQTRLEAALARTTTPVQIVRKMVPLAIHAGARPAALAWCCADAQGKGDAMAKALFAADPSELTAEGCEQIALRIGCDRERYRADMPRMTDRIAADQRDARAAGVRGLPTLLVGDERITGASASAAELVAVIERSATSR